MHSGLEKHIVSALRQHPAVLSVQLVGSRAEGRATERSDWDFCIETDDFDALASALPQLLAPLAPLAQQWDRFGSYRCRMLVLPGPVKVELLFPDQPQASEPAWVATAENLVAIDRQFWDWTLWASSKEAARKDELVVAELRMLFDHLLAPLGAEKPPASVADAVENYRAVRRSAERRFGAYVPRDLETAVVALLPE